MIVETNYPHCILERDKVSYLHQNIYTWILSTYLSAGAAVQTVRHLPGQAAVPGGAEGHPGGSREIRHAVNILCILPRQGDKAVVFPCSMFNASSPHEVFCFNYVSVARGGAVTTVTSRCLPASNQGESSEARSEERSVRQQSLPRLGLCCC